MSDLGEISAEVRAALNNLERVLNRFGALDRAELGPLEAELRRSPQTRQAAALIAQARSLVRQAGSAVTAARSAGSEWLALHGSSDSGGSGGAATPRPSPGGGEGSASFSSATLEAVWAGGINTPGGRAYFTPDEGRVRECAAALPPYEGEYTIDMHGSADRVGFGQTELDAAELAELVAADPSWGGRPVRLFSCNTGRGANPIAARLAGELGVKVTAPDNLVWSSIGSGPPVVAPAKSTIVNGEMVEEPDREREGAWREFEP